MNDKNLDLESTSKGKIAYEFVTTQMLLSLNNNDTIGKFGFGVKILQWVLEPYLDEGDRSAIDALDAKYRFVDKEKEYPGLAIIAKYDSDGQSWASDCNLQAYGELLKLCISVLYREGFLPCGTRRDTE